MSVSQNDMTCELRFLPGIVEGNAYFRENDKKLPIFSLKLSMQT